MYGCMLLGAIPCPDTEVSNASQSVIEPLTEQSDAGWLSTATDVLLVAPTLLAPVHALYVPEEEPPFAPLLALYLNTA